VIRKTKSEDAPLVLKLVTSILSDEFPDAQSAYAVDDLHRLAETYKTPNSVFFVAEESRQIIGTCGIKADGTETAILRRLFVDKKFRGKGVGYKLLQEALSFCKKRGFREVVIRTSTQMDQAIRLCLSVGFVEDGRWPMGQVTLIIYRLRLS
jgi:GNAT superfamily N-acetyltransferase